MMKEAEKLMNGSVHEDDLFILHDALVLMTLKEMITWIKENNDFHHWLLPMNGLQDRTPYAGRHVGNSPEFMPLYDILNREILHSFPFHCILIHFVLGGEGIDEEEINMRFGFSTPKETARGIKRIRESKMGTPSSARIIQDVDMALKSLEICLPRKWGCS